MDTVLDEKGGALLHCGLLPARLVQADRGLVLTVNQQQYELAPVISGSGARYQTADGQTEFWQRGEQGRLTLEGQAWPECIGDKQLPTAFQARGNEPFWLLRIDRDQVELNRLGFDQYESGLITQRRAKQGAIISDLVLNDQEEQLTVERQICNDNMTGMPYPYRVSMTREGRLLEGCGGQTQSLIQGPLWSVEWLLGSEPGVEAEMTLYFTEEGQIVGKAACNRYTGAYHLSGEGLNFSAIAQTRMACERPLMALEHRFLAALSDVSRLQITDDKQLTLFVGDTPVMHLGYIQ